jgi:hypothetical protein
MPNTSSPKLDRFNGYVEVSAEPTGFFRVERIAGMWWLIDPDGHGFVSIALNHLDETDLKYPRNIDIWKHKYGSRVRWIDAAVEDLRNWGFNTVGWTQQWVTGRHGHDLDWVTPVNLGHGETWSLEELQRVDMPYVQQLRVAEIEGWNGHPKFPDVFSNEFDEHCAWLARQYCAPAAEDPNLIGYFLTDIPSWLPHASGGNFAGLPRGAHDGPSRSLREVAEKYYETIAGHIRTYDPNHMILGDRYNGNMGIPEEVLAAAAPHIDLLSIQYFCGNDDYAHAKMRDDLGSWSAAVDLPVIIADIGNCAPTALNPDRESGLVDHTDRGRQYVDSFHTVVGEPWFVGWHWCSYLENEARGWGLKSGADEAYEDMTKAVADCNRAVYQTRLGR